MTIDFNCRKCDGTFEIEGDDLISGAEKLVCPHCDTKAPVALVDDFISALAELRTQVAALSKKFAVSLAVESEEIEEEVDEDEDEDDTDEDDELDFDDEDEDLDEEAEDLEDEDTDDR